MSLLVLGGQQRNLRPLQAGNQDWHGYQRGLILQVRPETGEVQLRKEYVSPPAVCAEENPEILFQASDIRDGRLYTCTPTEVLVYTLPGFEQVGYLSLPCFNDVHHVRATPEGNVLVASAGLDLVLETTLDGEIRRTWSPLGEDPWQRFSKDVDYRKVASTKPHRSHPNYLFYVGEDIWVTRFQQSDAICLTRPDQRVTVADERIHDGVLHDGRIYFTTVNGKVVVVNPETLRVEETIDLSTMHPEGMLLGWCRSLAFDGGKMWVGFSRIRATKSRENVAWVLRGFRNARGTHIACYDLHERRCVADIDLEPDDLNAVFSIFTVVD